MLDFLFLTVWGSSRCIGKTAVLPMQRECAHSTWTAAMDFQTTSDTKKLCPQRCWNSLCAQYSSSVVELWNLIYRGDAGLHFCIQVNLTLLNRTRRVPKLSETWGPLKWPRVALFPKKILFFRILPQKIAVCTVFCANWKSGFKERSNVDYFRSPEKI